MSQKVSVCLELKSRMTASETAGQPAGQTVGWKNFQEAREAMDAMPLEELEALSGTASPRQLPFPGWAIMGGGAFLLIGLFSRNGWLALLGGIIGGYGLIALNLNGSRAANYRQACYRAYVQGKALEMQDEDED
jgi:hypothetical protein